MNTMLPFLMMDSESEDDSLLMMVLMNSMTGGLDSADGFANNFNMLLPMLLGSYNNYIYMYTISSILSDFSGDKFS